MKMFVVLAALLAVVVARPQHAPENGAQILKYENENIGVDGYKFAYETSDGVSRSESAEVKNLGSENESLAITGTISWVDKDNNKYTLNFVADENGFQPQGAHLPH